MSFPMYFSSHRVWRNVRMGEGEGGGYLVVRSFALQETWHWSEQLGKEKNKNGEPYRGRQTCWAFSFSSCALFRPFFFFLVCFPFFPSLRDMGIGVCRSVWRLSFPGVPVFSEEFGGSCAGAGGQRVRGTRGGYVQQAIWLGKPRFA